MVATDKEKYAQRLNEALADAGYQDIKSRKEILKKWTGVSLESTRKWLSGLSVPTYERSAMFAQKLNISLNWLLSGEGNKTAATGKVHEPQAQYQGLDWITERDIRILKNVHKMSESDQSRYEEFSAVMVSKGTGQTSENE